MAGAGKLAGMVRVVTVDDQPQFHAAAEAVVARTPGFELVGEVRDGPAALRAMPALDPDLVIVDVRMPGMDGLEVVERLRAQDTSRVIVLATDSPDPHARECGAAALVRKHWLTPRMLRGLWVAHRRR
jgi:DNA-binding NarL/FixJ family response regulator